ncbi:MAG TPA: hypothetical protein VNJ03_17445 [Vicinamibacterales bacterium]|nr:hypothetical protein [Vicinamibacterales bacterium]
MTAAFVAAVFVLLLATLPPRAARIPLDAVDRALVERTVSGAYHIHTSRSDGAEDKRSVAAAAARAGLQFAIFTDHGDGMRPPDPPAYVNGVLCLDGVEISTTGGHYVAIDLPAAPYPLGGEAAAVVEDVSRLGGFGIAAHPDHPKGQLAWTDGDAPIDGIEWINADSEWRNETPTQLARVLFNYMIRPGPALASVFDRPNTTLARWDAMEKGRSVVALAAADAHGGRRLPGEQDGGAAFGGGPGYEASFRSLSNRVIVDRPLTGDAVTDARLVMDGVRQGRVYSVVDAISKDVLLSFDAKAGDGFAVASRLPEDAHVITVPAGLRKRIEVHAPRAPGNPPVPWVLSNWTGSRPPSPLPPVGPLPAFSAPLAVASEWRVEKDPASSGRVSGGGAVVSLEFKLRAGERASQFVAAGADLRAVQPFDRLAFRGRASRAMRVSFQLRLAPDDSRWVTSVVLGPEDRDIVIGVGELRPAGGTGSRMPAVDMTRSILFVVDLVNARPGDSGSFTISDLRMAR